MTHHPNLIADIRKHFDSYSVLEDSSLSLVLALWAIGTHCFNCFDAFGYLIITASTKQAGKTRLAELISMVANKGKFSTSMTRAVMFTLIETEKPTIFFDEAEELNSESSTLRSLLNVGYRRGQKIGRMRGSQVVDYDTYCPKAFILIGDVYDTLRDRSVVITMKRTSPPNEFVYSAVLSDAELLRIEIESAVKDAMPHIISTYESFPRMAFLGDRDRELWKPLFTLCRLFCPDQERILARIASDLAADKTAPKKTAANLLKGETSSTNEWYSAKLLQDVAAVASGKRYITTAEMLPALKDLDTSPWRKFKGEGLTAQDAGDMLSRFGLKPKSIKVSDKGNTGARGGRVTGTGRSIVKRGYKQADILRAVQTLGQG